MLLTFSGRADALARRLLYALLACLFFSSDPLSAQPHVVSGTVRTADGRPLAGAVIRVSGATGEAGPLADGSRGRVLTFDRTAEMLARRGGRIGETAWLHDIPLGRYRVSAEAPLPGGRRQTFALRDNAGGQAASAIEIGFPAYQMAPYGIRSASLTIVGAADG